MDHNMFCHDMLTLLTSDILILDRISRIAADQICNMH